MEEHSSRRQGAAEQILTLTRQVIAGSPLTREQADVLVAIDPPQLLDLFRGASAIREHFLGNAVRCCSIVAAKVGRCGEDCAFCSQSGHYRTAVQGQTLLSATAVLQAADAAAASGAEAFGIVNSGYAPTDLEVEDWGRVAGQIGGAGRLRACASLGVLTLEQARRLRELGVTRYNHNLQTSRRHFSKITTTHSYDDRVQTLRHLRAAGISVCSGGLFGMGEDWSDRLDLAFELRAIGPDVIPLNFLIAIDGTPLAGTTPLSAMECLKIIAVFRFLFPREEIKIAGGREVHLRDLQSWIFFAGADSFLIGNYLTTCGRKPEDDLQMVRDLGLTIGGRQGGSASETAATPCCSHAS